MGVNGVSVRVVSVGVVSGELSSDRASRNRSDGPTQPKMPPCALIISIAALWCRIGWHDYVRQPGHEDPNDQVCLRCHKKRSASSIIPLSGGEGGSGFG